MTTVLSDPFLALKASSPRRAIEASVDAGGYGPAIDASIKENGSGPAIYARVDAPGVGPGVDARNWAGTFGIRGVAVNQTIVPLDLSYDFINRNLAPAGVVGACNIGGAGVVGTANGGIGVYGRGDTGVYGVEGVPPGSIAGLTGTGVRGFSKLNTGTTGGTTSGHGVFGYAFSYGVGGFFQSAQYLGPGLTVYGTAGEFHGNVKVSGTINKAACAFKIDHPLDPANKYLLHSCVESPDMKNLYDGVAKLDSRGRAAVRLPAWFGALNKDLRYQLTALGRAAPDLHIARELKSNRFEIAGGPPGARVCWQVTGIRRDKWAEANRIRVEEPKSRADRGRYLHPQAFGAKTPPIGLRTEVLSDRKGRQKPGPTRAARRSRR